jgi:hypothetical protein
VKRKQGEIAGRIPLRVKVFSPENLYVVEQAQVITNTEGSYDAIVKGEMVDTPPGS